MSGCGRCRVLLLRCFETPFQDGVFVVIEEFVERKVYGKGLGRGREGRWVIGLVAVDGN